MTESTSAAVLVAYVSPGGSTKEVADAIAETLTGVGLRVTNRPMTEVSGLADYRAVVLGAPIYNTLWHQTALAFLTQQRAALSACPVAVFALGPVLKGEPIEFTRARQQLEIGFRRFPWFQPVDMAIFGGKRGATNPGFPLNLLVKPTPAVDFRAWDTIHAWAAALPVKLGVAGG